MSLSGNTITATVSNATSYSFNSNFSSNTKTYTIPDLTSSDVQLNLNGSTTQQKTITYYVKNSSGTVKTCSINVSITCTCKYMYANICYKNQERGTYSSGSNACNGSNVWKSGDWCYKHLDPGYSCTFTRK